MRICSCLLLIVTAGCGASLGAPAPSTPWTVSREGWTRVPLTEAAVARLEAEASNECSDACCVRIAVHDGTGDERRHTEHRIMPNAGTNLRITHRADGSVSLRATIQVEHDRFDGVLEMRDAADIDTLALLRQMLRPVDDPRFSRAHVVHTFERRDADAHFTLQEIGDLRPRVQNERYESPDGMHQWARSWGRERTGVFRIEGQTRATLAPGLRRIDSTYASHDPRRPDEWHIVELEELDSAQRVVRRRSITPYSDRERLIELAYDAHGRLTSLTMDPGPAAHRLVFTHQADGTVLITPDPCPRCDGRRAAEILRDENGLQIGLRLTESDGTVQNFSIGRDPAGLATQLITPTGERISAEYNAAGALVTEVAEWGDANSRRLEREYDELGRLRRSTVTTEEHHRPDPDNLFFDPSAPEYVTTTERVDYAYEGCEGVALDIHVEDGHEARLAMVVDFTQ